jgi:hypothetical protein
LETPDQMLARLETMGPDRVRALMGMRRFEKKTLPLVKGWLKRKDDELAKALLEAAESRDGASPAETERALHNTRTIVRQASASAHKLARSADETAQHAWRLALVALVVASLGAVASFLALFILALR